MSSVRLVRDPLRLVLPLSPEFQAILHIPRHLTEEEWAQMLRVLDLMRSGIVSSERAEHTRENENYPTLTDVR